MLLGKISCFPKGLRGFSALQNVRKIRAGNWNQLDSNSFDIFSGRTSQQAVPRFISPGVVARLEVRDLRIGKHKFEIHFSRKDDPTQFEVLKGDAEIVERCNLQQKIARLKVESDPI